MLLRDVGLVSMQSGVVVQLLPWERMRLRTQAEEAPERGDGIDDMAAHLFDHEALNGPDLLPACIVNSGALNVIALDQRMARGNRQSACFRHSSSPPVFDPTALRIELQVRGSKRSLRSSTRRTSQLNRSSRPYQPVDEVLSWSF